MPQSLKVDASTNRLALTQAQTALDGGFCYDKFGNMVTDNGACPSDVVNIPALYNYDVANRLTGSGPAHGNYVYMYNAQNQRVAVIGTGHAASEQVFFYGFKGEKLATINPATVTASTVVENVYFAGQLWMQGLDPRVGTNVLNVDRIGSVRESLFNFPGGGSTPGTTYLPFGEELNAAGSDREKVGTYTRDSATGFDYANQRFHNSQYGRFMNADPYQTSAGPADPASWNKYSYTRNDPINRVDPNGTCDETTYDVKNGVLQIIGINPCTPIFVNGFSISYIPQTQLQQDYESGACNLACGRPCYDADRLRRNLGMLSTESCTAAEFVDLTCGSSTAVAGMVSRFG